MNVYQINLFQHINVMHRLSIDDLPKHFSNTFKQPDHKYPTKFSICNYRLKKHSWKSSKFAVSYRGPKLQNEFVSNKEKKIESRIQFQKRVKSKLWDMENMRHFHISKTLLFKMNEYIFSCTMISEKKIMVLMIRHKLYASPIL